jgi:hypothetical protein
VGRYHIEGLLGAGGMAVVYLARDPVLDRAVALKVMRVDDDDAGAARLVREGQALARVSHRNVIHVYEVGRESDGLVYVAMERIVGVTLAAWLEQPRTRAEIVDAFVAAARGLAAAHAAGLVHRDFKPENVMVGDDGRVCVLDFGLARAADDADPRGGRAASGALTATAFGSVIGTPAYMSPEQWRGERASAASDQFSFCVALWRALTGEHPFALGSRDALRASVIAGAANRLPRALPRRLRRALRRGIAVDPAARFASLGALVAAIDARPRRRWPVALAGLAAVAAVGIAGRVALEADEPQTTLYSAPAAITARGDVARGSVSPDGNQLALLTRDAVIVQALRVGAEERVVLRGRLAYHALSWSPDGAQLAVVAGLPGSEPGLVLVDVATGAARRIADDVGSVALIGGGELASARFSDRALTFVSYSGPAPGASRSCPLSGQYTGIRRLSHDAAHDAVYVQLDDTDRGSSVVRVDRRCAIEVVADRVPILSFVIRPGDHRLLMREMWGSHHLVEIGDDGRARLGQHVIQSNDYAPLAVLAGGAIAHRNESAHWALHAIGRDGARVELGGGVGESRFSLAADGRIAQIEDLYGRGLLKVGRPVAAGEARPSGPGALDGMAPIAERAVRGVWSPDGRRLAVLLQTAQGYRLASWDAASRALTTGPLLATPYDVELTWLDGDRVAYPVLNDRTEFRWVDLRTGASGTIVPRLGQRSFSLVRAHGDRRLAFVTEGARGATVWTLVEGGLAQPLATVPIAAPRPSESLRVTWAADDRSIVLCERGSGEMWSIAASGAEPGTVERLAISDALRSRALTRVSDVFALADRMVVASVVTSADVYVSAPIAE